MTVAVGTGGKVSVFNHFGNAHVIFDVVGYYSTATGPFGSRFHGVTPFRYFDTRDGTGGVAAAQVGQGGRLKFKVTGKGGVPRRGVTAVVMNVTVTEPTATASSPCTPTTWRRPNASNLNYVPGLTVPNLVDGARPRQPASSTSTTTTAPPTSSPTSSATTTATRPPRRRFFAVTPFRRFDSRVSSPFPAPGKIRRATAAPATPATRASFPRPGRERGHQRDRHRARRRELHHAFPPDGPLPLASNLNFVPGQTVPNLVIVRVSSGPLPNGITTPGWIGHFNNFGNTHLVIDVFGYFTASFTDVVGSTPRAR